MKLTVILCTYNRCELLDRALSSLATSRMFPSTFWEVLVVDNNSGDQTHEVVKKYAVRDPERFRYVFEPQPGKSFALNTGIREARGDVLAFVDDDVTVDADWLSNLTLGASDSAWAGAGGRVLPVWSLPRPGWLPTDDDKSSLAPLVLFDLGEQPTKLAEPPYGTNMAFRKEMFEKYGGFRTDLGPRPGSEIRGEDSAFAQRLLDGGEYLRYEPAAVVHHPVSADRLRKGYFLAWWFDKGRSEIRVYGFQSGTKYLFAGVPLYLVRRITMWTVRWAFAISPVERFRRKKAVWNLAGQIFECLARRAHRSGAGMDADERTN